MGNNSISKYKRRQFAALLILLLLIILLVSVITSIVRSVNKALTPVMADPGPYTVEYLKLEFNRYKNENFVFKDGKKYYYDNSDLRSRTGIDVSFAQKEIDWEKVKADGIEFAMIRLGFRGYETGNICLDDYFLKNISGAQSAGVETGVYFFSQALNEQEAIEEAEYVIEQLKEFDITFPVAFDWEVVEEEKARTNHITGDELNRCALAFCEKIAEAGYKPVIYASLNLLRSQFDKYDVHNIADYNLWLAEYKRYPEFPYYFRMWQFTDDGKVDGINYPTDINIYFDIDPSTH